MRVALTLDKDIRGAAKPFAAALLVSGAGLATLLAPVPSMPYSRLPQPATLKWGREVSAPIVNVTFVPPAPRAVLPPVPTRAPAKAAFVTVRGPKGTNALLTVDTMQNLPLPDPASLNAIEPHFILPDAATAEPATAEPGYRQMADGIEFSVGTRINGQAGGKLTLWIAGAVAGRTAQPATGLWVRLGDVLGLLSDRMEPAAFAKLSAAQDANAYVSLGKLRAAGVPVRFDDKDQLVFGAD